MQRDGAERDEIANLLGRSDALTEIAQTFDRAMEAAGEKEAADGGEVVFAGRKKYDPDREHALMPGEMKNEFYEAMNRGEWHEYFQTLNGKKYNPDYYPNGKRATMKQNDKLLLMRMQRNGEFTVVAMYRNTKGWYNDDIDYMLDKWRRGKYGLDEFETWLAAFAIDDGSGAFESYDRHGRRFVPINGKENGTGRGTAGVSGGRNAHGKGFHQSAFGQTGAVRGDGKFSLNKPVERVGDLIAVHNVDPEGLKRSLELGGMPAPSIAVIKVSGGHAKFGAISMVFDKSSIDPEADARNKVYGYDAWTPDKKNARIEYEVNERVESRAKNVV